MLRFGDSIGQGGLQNQLQVSWELPVKGAHVYLVCLVGSQETHSRITPCVQRAVRCWRNSQVNCGEGVTEGEGLWNPLAPSESWWSTMNRPLSMPWQRRVAMRASASTRRRCHGIDNGRFTVDAVATSLRYEGFGVDEAVNGRLALSAAQENPPDLIVLDMMLPDLDGLEVTRRLRADGIRVPILFLTARDAIEDKVAGLTVGGDDYVTKPFALAEIVARVHAILRRIGSEPEDEGILRFADIEMDESAHEVTRAGQPVALTATEFNLLRFFLLNPRHVLSKAQILDHVWHYDFGGGGNVVETYVSYLRKKLEAVGPPVIHTVRQVGYALREPVAA